MCYIYWYAIWYHSLSTWYNNYGRHLGFQNYPILVFWQCNPVNLHPNLASTQHTFAKDVLSLLATREDTGNQFLEDYGDMLTLDTKGVMNKDVIRTVNAVEEIVQRQCSESVEDRLNIAPNKPLSGIALCQRINCSVHLKQSRGQEAKNKLDLWRQSVLSSLISTLLAKLGKATSTVSLNMEIRRALRPFLIWANCDRDRNRT